MKKNIIFGFVLLSALIFTNVVSADITTNLKPGDINPQVTILQKILNGIGKLIAPAGPGSPGLETDKFGSLTASAVRSFQCEKGIVCSGTPETTGWGTVGPKTRTFLNSLFSSLGNLFSNRGRSNLASVSSVIGVSTDPTYYNSLDDGGAPGKISNAKSFDGATSVSASSATQNVTSAITISAWVQPSSLVVGSWYTIVSQQGADSTKPTSDNYSLAIGGDGSVGIWGKTGNALSSTQVITGGNGNWYHIVGVITPSQTRIYVNNSLLKSTSVSQTFDTNSTKPIIIGAEMNTALDSFFKGIIDDVRIYNRDLTASEITSLNDYAGDTATNPITVPPSYTLTISKVGAGTVTGTNTNGTIINCGTDCVETVSDSSSIILTATPSSGYTFSGWSGGYCTGTGACNVPMTATRNVTATFTTLSTVTSPTLTSNTLQKLKISANKRFLVKEDGTPFFWQNDTAWALPKLSNEDVDYYLNDRAAKGFNGTMVSLKYHSDILFNGEGPFLNNNTDTPNLNFFNHLDYIISKADTKGMYVAITMMWAEDWQSLVNTDAQKAARFANWIGTRYKDQNNIIWIVSGEYNHVATWSKSVYDSVAQGLRTGDAGNHLITIHPTSFESSSKNFQGSSLYDFNILQASHYIDSNAHGYPENYEIITSDWNMSTVKPVADGEYAYEVLPDGYFITGDASGTKVSATDIRRRAYGGVFAGGFGTTYGDANIEMLYTGVGETYGATMTWKNALNNTGATQIRHLRTLIESKPFLTRIPDQSVVTAGIGTGLAHVRATRDSNGTYAFVYIPQGGPVTINMAKISGTAAKASWFNPKTGATTVIDADPTTTVIDTYPNTGTRSFDPSGNTAYGNDWVLILESASATNPNPVTTGNWYVDGTLTTGLNDGTSWANAWRGFSAITWSKIQPGHTLYMSGGATSKTYATGLSVGASGTSDTSRITIRAGQDIGHKGKVFISSGGINLTNRHFVTVDGELNGQRNIEVLGTVEAGEANHFVLRYLDIHNSNIGIGATYGLGGKISYNYLHDIRDQAGIQMNARNRTRNTNGDLIGIPGYNQTIIDNNTILLNSTAGASGTGPDGIQGAWGVTVENNWFGRVDGTVTGEQHQDMIQMMANYVTIRGNTFTGSGDSSIDYDTYNGNPAYHQIYNNVFILTRGSGIRYYSGGKPFTSMEDIHIMNNTFVDHVNGHQWALSVANIVGGTLSLTDVAIKNNLFYNNILPVYIEASSAATQADWNFDFNLINGGTSGGTGVVIDGADYTQANPRTAAPTFAQYTSGNIDSNLHLASNDTAAMNQGISLATYFTTDKDGISRPYGTAWDIGAYEFGGTVTNPVNVAPLITTQPLSQTIPSGGSAILSVTINSSAYPAPTYQWYKDGAPISGETASSYTTYLAGTYKVTVTNTAGIVTSANAVVTVTNPIVLPPPNIDNGGILTVIAGTPTAFNLTTPGKYKLTGSVIASLDNSNSFHVDVDTNPLTSESKVWHIKPFTGSTYEPREVTWGTFDAFPPAKIFTLTSGQHTLFVNKRPSEPTTQIENMRFDIADLTPPTVSISSPIAGSTISSSATLTANASDPIVALEKTSGVASVQFKVNDQFLGSPDTSAPYTGLWENMLDGAYSLTAVATDIAGNTTISAPVSVTVSTPTTNQDPKLDPIGSKYVNENSTLTFTLYSTDTVGDTQTFTATGLPSGADLTGNTFKWTPLFDQSGTYSVTFKVEDLSGAFDTETVSITVNNVNRAPVANAGPDQTITLSSPAPLFAGASYDPDGNALNALTFTWSKVSGPVSGVVTFTNGSLASASATFSTAGTYTLKVAVSDGNLATTDDVVIYVNPIPTTGDDDSDGVPNELDVCPLTAALLTKANGTVNNKGCPLPKMDNFTIRPTTASLADADLRGLTTLELGNKLYGKVTWNTPGTTYPLVKNTTYGKMDVDAGLKIAFKSISLDPLLPDPELSELNKRATLTFFGINKKVRSKIARDGTLCYTTTSGAKTCRIPTTYDSALQTLSFTVDGFSTYTIEDAPELTISLKSPKNNANLKSPIALEATPSDTYIENVSFYANNKLIGEDTTSPYSLNFSPAKGIYTILAVAKDGDFSATSSPVTITIKDVAKEVGGETGAGNNKGKSKTGTFTPTPTPAVLSALTNTLNLSPFNIDLQKDMDRIEVKYLQQFLNANNCIVSNTGVGSPGYESTYFGGKTWSALRDFQIANLIDPPKGYFGVKTRKVVNDTLPPTNIGARGCLSGVR